MVFLVKADAKIEMRFAILQNLIGKDIATHDKHSDVRNFIDALLIYVTHCATSSSDSLDPRLESRTVANVVTVSPGASSHENPQRGFATTVPSARKKALKRSGCAVTELGRRGRALRDASRTKRARKG
jgi:hypothetical protein